MDRADLGAACNFFFDVNFGAVDAVSASTAWIGGGPIDVCVARTTDGGLTWTQENLPGEPLSLTSLAFLTTDQGWAAGDGIFLRTP
jgi:photosystem II stability/assembly factor-like uncharacterized protein